MEDEKIVCVQLAYKKLSMVADDFSGPSEVKTGIVIISSTVLRSHSLQKIICEMCIKADWVPMVFQRLDGQESTREYDRKEYSRALIALTA